MERYDIIFIGGGIITGSVVYYLYKKGFNGKVLILEKNNALAQEATSLSAGGFRNLWSTMVNMKMTSWSIKELAKFEKEIGMSIGFHQRGYLFTFYEKDFENIKEFYPTWGKYGVNAELLTPEEIEKKVPGMICDAEKIDPEIRDFLEMESIVGGLFGPDCGEFNPTTAAQGYFEYTMENNKDKIEIKLKSEIEKIIVEGKEAKGIKLTNGEEIFADKVVLTAGAYSTKIMEQSGFEGDDLIPMVPWKRMLFVVKMPPIEGFEEIPMTIIDNGVYFRPEAGNLLVGKANNDQEYGFFFDPEPQYYEDEMNTYMQARIPGTEYCRIVSSQSMWGGLYAHNTQDKNAIIGKHISVDNLYLATAFSGHGAMEAPAAGISLAEIIMTGKPITIPEVEQLSMERFKKGELIKETIVI